MKIKKTLKEIDEFVDNEELTPRHMGILLAITFGFIAVSGIISYLIVFVYLGY